MTILVIDGMGGGIGRSVIEKLRPQFPEITIIAVGTNSAATSAMLSAGADMAATGENAVVVNCKTADLIIGTLGIVLANSMLGEITPRMALEISSSPAKKLLIPTFKCNAEVVGIQEKNTSHYIDAIPAAVERMFKEEH